MYFPNINAVSIRNYPHSTLELIKGVIYVNKGHKDSTLYNNTKFYQQMTHLLNIQSGKLNIGNTF